VHEAPMVDPTSTAGSARDTVLILPAYNEATRLGRVLAGVRHSAPDLAVLVIDDGSHDGTAAVAREHGVEVVSHPCNLRYGAALQTVYKGGGGAGSRYLEQMAADGKHDPADVVRLLAPLRADAADVVIGSRFVEASGYRMSAARTAGREFFQRLLVACGG